MALNSGLAGRVNDNNVKWYTLIAACFGLFMAILDNLVVNIAMPTIQTDLDAEFRQLQWIVSAYTIVFASLQITAGGLGDRFGRKRWFLAGLALFTVTSLLAALSQSIEMLIAMRALQGLGAAFIMPLSLSLISAAFPPEERGKAVGIWGAISVSGIALGPVVGGALVEYASWEWVFLINVPIGIIAFFVTQAVVRESHDDSGTVATDIPGTLLITGAIASLTYGLIEAGDRGWTEGIILGAFAVAAVLTAAFLWVENRAERPMVPLRFFRSSTFTGANIDAFLIAFLITGVSFFMTLYQQNVHGYSAIKTGLALLPMVLVMMVISPIAGAMTSRMGARQLLSFGMIVTGIGTLLFLRSSAGASYWDILPAFMVMGFGMSFLWTPMTTAVLNSVESSKSGIASAINGATREIGTAFGVALLGTLANRAYQDRYAGNDQIQAIKANSALAPLQWAVDGVGESASNGGRVIYNEQLFPGIAQQAPDLAATIASVSSRAFVTGMDRAIIFSGVAIIIASAISYIMIKDDVVASPVVDPAAAPDADFAESPAD